MAEKPEMPETSKPTRDRILAALGASVEAVKRTPLVRPAQMPGDSREAWEMLGRALASLGADFRLAGSGQEAVGEVVEAARLHGVRSALLWEHPLLERLGLAAALAGASVDVIPNDSETRFCPHANIADMGVTAADAVFLETGTVAVWAGPGRERATSLVPPLHVALVEESVLRAGIADLADLLRELAASTGLPSAVHCITGPSTTADIGQVLVRGAHGPKTVVVVGLAQPLP